MQTFTVKPSVTNKVVQLVRDPESYQALAVKGEVKPRNNYWLRRIKDGSVIEVTATTEKKEA